MNDIDHPNPLEGSRESLGLTASAREEIRRRLAGREEAAFFVTTQPSRLGFNVGVGFEAGSGPGERPENVEFDVPVRISLEDFERLRGYTIDFRDGRFVTFTDVLVHASETPNPRSRKFTLNRKLIEQGSASFAPPGQENDPLLARYVMEVPGVVSIFLMDTFCSVTAEEGADWEVLRPEIGKRLQAYFAHGGAPIPAGAAAASRYGDVERRIIEVLEDVVRPAVQRDGGDIAFAGFEDGTVQLYMLGSCVGCPSSLATLKMGVEGLLREAVPEVKEVVTIT